MIFLVSLRKAGSAQFLDTESLAYPPFTTGQTYGTMRRIFSTRESGGHIMANDKPKLGQFGLLIVETVLPGFCEKKFWGGRKLTLAKYLGAYLTVASQGVLVGLRFRHAPLAIVKLICGEGAECGLAEELRHQASKLASEFRHEAIGFLDVAMLRERQRLLNKLGEANLPDDPFALNRLMSERTVNIEQARSTLTCCFGLFLGLGLFESDWIMRLYADFMPGEDQLQKDMRPLEQLVKSWVSELSPSLLTELFPS